MRDTRRDLIPVLIDALFRAAANLRRRRKGLFIGRALARTGRGFRPP
jgi:hypothetical protein